MSAEAKHGSRVVSLAEVVEALDLQSDEVRSFLDPEAGKIITFNEEEASVARGGDWESAPDWMKPELPKIKRALDGERMLELPDRIHIDEWRMMQDFAEEEAQCACRTELISASHGAKAFRTFKDAVDRLGIEREWFAFREAAYQRLAREWLEQNNIPYRP
jgi:hypothetical protein